MDSPDPSLPKRRGWPLPVRTVMLLAGGISATIVAWGVLVFAAIDFGRRGRQGDSIAWLFLVLATIGAIGCAFLAIQLLATLQNALRQVAEPSERPAPAGRSSARRAARSARHLAEPEPEPELTPEPEPTPAPASPRHALTTPADDVGALLEDTAAMEPIKFAGPSRPPGPPA